MNSLPHEQFPVPRVLVISGLAFLRLQESSGRGAYFQGQFGGKYTDPQLYLFSPSLFKTYTSTGTSLELRTLPSCGLRGCFQLLFYRQTILEPYLEAAHLTGLKVKASFFP